MALLLATVIIYVHTSFTSNGASPLSVIQLVIITAIVRCVGRLLYLFINYTLLIPFRGVLVLLRNVFSKPFVIDEL